MDLALEQARAALAAGEVPVGVVVVRGDAVVAVGRNDTRAVDATRHAEILMLEVLPREWLRDCHVFVTVEPCVMCAAAMAEMGVAHVTFACRNAKFGGFGSVLDVRTTFSLPLPRVSVDHANAPRAVALLREFYAQKNPRVKQ